MPIKLEGFSGGDRTDIVLPGVAGGTAEGLIATGTPVVVVLQNGSALAVNYAAEHAAAILEAWYPGEEGGTAIARDSGRRQQSIRPAAGNFLSVARRSCRRLTTTR